MGKLLYLNWLEWESACWWVWLEGSEVHLVRNLLGDHGPATLTLCVTLKKKRGKFVEFPVCVVHLKRKLYWPNTPIVSSGSERCLVVSEGWLNQTSPPPLIHLPLKTRLLSHIPTVTTSHRFCLAVPLASAASPSPSAHPPQALQSVSLSILYLPELHVRAG